jgi:hypothetical protein
MRKILLLILLFAHPVSAATLQVGPARTYTNLNAALAAATSGDIIEMDEDITFTQCSVLPNKGALGSPIIIRSSNATQPGAGVRFDPSTYAANVAILQAANTGCPALGTAVGAQDYIIGPGLKFLNVPSAYRGIIELGANTSSQMLEADQPQDITIDRVWLVGDPWIGQKVGIDLNGKNLAVQNSYIEGIKGVGQDAVGLRCFNGTGPITIFNNYINAAGYGFICGGDQPYMMQFADASAATTTTATLTNIVNRSGGTHLISTLHVDQYISVLASAGTIRYHPKVLSCGTSTPGAACTSANITFEAIPAAPDTGTAGDIQWGAIPSDLSIRRNYFWKDPAWMNNILATPVISSATPSTSSGSLPAATYYYRVQATYCCYQTSRIYSTAATEVSAVLSATGKVTVSWGAVSGPSYITYRVFRSTASGVFAGYIDVGNVTSYVDTGTALTGTSTPAGGTNWVMKNAMEIKFANRVQIDSNIFENSPVGAESGYAIWFKSNNYGSANYMFTRDVVFEKNIMDGMDGCFSILGRIDSAGADFTRPLENLTIRNNICLDSNTSWMQGKATVYAIKTQSPIINLTIENNTFQHTMRGLMYLTKTSNPLSSPYITNFKFRNNMARKETYAVFGGGCSQNNITECFTEAVTGTSPFDGNCLGGVTGTNPVGNTIIPYTEYEGATHFDNYQATGGTPADFVLDAASSCKGDAVGGGDPGANIAAILAATTGVTTGAVEGSSSPTITTTSPLTAITQSSAMTPVVFAVSGGTPSYTWAVNTGSTLPAGLSLSSGGTLSGTPTTPGTYTFTIKVTDSTSGTALVATKQFSLTVDPASATLTIITTSPLTSQEVATPIDNTIVATGGTAPYSFAVTSGSLPSGATLSNAGVISGSADTPGAYSFTVTVTDAVAATDPQAYSWTISAESRPCGRQTFFSLGGIRVESSLFRRPTAPLSTAPDCAGKGDRWINTSTGEVKDAISSNPLVWAVAGGGTTFPDNVVLLPDATPPTAGDFIIGGDAGSWIKVGPASITGLDATAIKTGIIDADRLPLSTIATPYSLTFQASAAITQNNVPNAGDEWTSTSRYRRKADTQNFTLVNLGVSVVTGCGTAGTVTLQYLDATSTWVTAGATLACASGGLQESGWVTLVPGARGQDTLFRIWVVGAVGDTADPAFAVIEARFR